MKKLYLILTSTMIINQGVQSRHQNDDRRGYLENVGESTGDTVKDTGYLAGSLVGAGRDEDEGYLENIGHSTESVIKDVGFTAGSLFGFGRDRDNEDRDHHRSSRERRRQNKDHDRNYENRSESKKTSGTPGMQRRQARRQNRRGVSRNSNDYND